MDDMQHTASARRLPIFAQRENVKLGLPMEEHLVDIRIRQNAISGLIYDNGGLSAHWGGAPSPGCAACKANRWITIFVGKACNAVCTFCPQPPKPKLGDADDTDEVLPTSFGKMRWDELRQRVIAAAKADRLVSVGFSGGEPLMYIDRIVRFARTFGEAVPSLYQYAYTNGILGTREVYAELKQAGIRELRFDLAATKFSERVIANMSSAHEYFERVTIEIPALPEVVEPLRRLAPSFPELGVSQINLCEVVVNEYNVHAFKSGELYRFNLYDDLVGAEGLEGADEDAVERCTRLVPLMSRHATYDVIESAHSQGWKVVINDCSQGVHYKPELPL